MNPTAPLKRLRFEYHPRVDESICGALSEACRDQRLVPIASALEGAGLHLTRPGRIQLAQEGDLARLAIIMRTDVDRLRPLAFSTTPRNGYVALGELEMPGQIFDLATRWIGPTTLLKDAYHRSAWLNRLLPYCPTSLELLVGACPKCGPLGWRHTRGVANCEFCGETVPPSPESPLDAEHGADYRLAARLMSHDAVAAEAMNKLPPMLRAFPRTAIVGVLIRLGAAVSLGATGGLLEDIRQRTPPALARALCEGMRMLRGWPRSIREHVDQQTIQMEDDLSAYEALRVALRRASGRTDAGRAIVATAFPKIDGRTADTFAGATEYYTASQTNRKLWTVSRDLKLVRDAGGVRFEKLPSKVRLRARYHAGDVDALAEQLANCTAPGSAAVAVGVPTYAIEQIATSRAEMVIDHPGVAALRGPQVASDRLADLIRRLGSRARKCAPPTHYIPLRNALAAHPGEKPWDLVVSAMLCDTLDFHWDGDEIDLREVLVDAASVRLLRRSRRDIIDGALGISHVSVRDACEIMAAGFEEGRAALLSAGLEIVPFGKGKGVTRDDFRDLVSKIAFTGEAAAHTGRNGIELHHEFTRIGVPRIHGAWSRRALAALGMVRTIPPASTSGIAASEHSEIGALTA